MSHINIIEHEYFRNNVGNLRYDPAIGWRGLIGHNDAGFCLFQTAKRGARAMYITIMDYIVNDNCNNIDDIINRYAPDSENNTEAYIKFVAHNVGIPRDSDSVKQSWNLYLVGKAISDYEGKSKFHVISTYLVGFFNALTHTKYCDHQFSSSIR